MKNPMKNPMKNHLQALEALGRKPFPCEVGSGKLYSGALLEADEEKVARALASVAAGVPQAKVAKQLKIGRMSLAALVRRAEADGRMPVYRERMRVKLEALVEDTVDARLASGAVLDGVTWGITFDKLQLLQGEPTEIVEVKDDSFDRINEALRRIRDGGDAIEVIAEVIEGKPKEQPKPPHEPKALPDARGEARGAGQT